MPLNDSMAQAPLMRPEHRAFKPLNVFSCPISNNSQMQEIQKTYNHTGEGDSFESRKFIKMECNRTPTDTPLTDWVQTAAKAPKTEYSELLESRIACGAKGSGITPTIFCALFLMKRHSPQTMSELRRWIQAQLSCQNRFIRPLSS